ncbi:ABC transporter substrate-binding protein [Oscillospiraceae bacterium PP1C4]
MKRSIFAGLLVLAISLSGCKAIDISDQQFDILPQQQDVSSVSEPEQTAPVSEVCLAYNMNDSLNPYTMTSQLNHELIPLLYDSLTRLDKTFKPQNQLATEVIVEGKLCTVKYNRSAQFSDGTLLTGKDIVYSIATASASDDNWKAMLQNVAGCSINDDGDVEIKLHQEDADFACLLSFPIIKENTATADHPTGVSKFYLSGMQGNDAVLTANQLYYGNTGNLKTIRLVGVSDADALTFSLKTGDIDVVYSDLNDTELSNMSTSSVPVSLNHLVYLGVNSGRGLLSKAEFRKAVSTALNRDELVSTAYLTRANAARYPFHPDFYRLQKMELPAPRNLTAADALLDGMGLTQKDADGYRLQNGTPITLSLLVNSENACRNAAATLIAGQLKQIGVKVDVVSKSFSQYQASLSRHDYDLYIGETRMMDNMDFSMLMSGGSLGFATAYSEELVNLYRAYKSTGTNIEAFCEAFNEQSPFIPLVFRQGLISFNREFRAEIVATEQDIFYNIVEW